MLVGASPDQSRNTLRVPNTISQPRMKPLSFDYRNDDEDEDDDVHGSGAEYGMA